MHKTLLLAAVALAFVAGGRAIGHEGHAIDPELLASKIRDRGHACERVVEAQEKAAKPLVLSVKCSNDRSYRLVVTDSEFQVTPVSSVSPTPRTPSTAAGEPPGSPESPDKE